MLMIQMNLMKTMNMILLFMIISMNNWMFMWMMTEIMMILNIMNMNNKIKNKEILIKFFILSSIMSYLMLMTIMIYNSNLIIKNSIIKNLMTMMIMMKLGMFPFSWWMMMLMKMNSWKIMFKMNFTLKIPYIVMMIMINNKSIMMINLMFMIPMISLNFLNLKKMMTMLSIFNMNWFMFTMNYNNKIMLLMFMYYMTMNYLLFSLMNMNKMNFVNQISSMSNKKKLMTMMMMMNLMSMPIFPMFMIKWLMIKMMKMNTIMFLSISLTNLLMMTNYFKFLILSMTKFNLINKKNTIKIKNKNNMIVSSLMMILLM